MGRYIIIALLLLFWCFLAYRAFSHGDTTMALVYAGIGAALTAWRIQRARS